MLSTADGGRRWTRESHLPKDVGDFYDVSCPTKTYCLTVGTSEDGYPGVALVSTNLGRSWKHLNLPSGEQPGTVVCVAPRNCLIAGRSSGAGTGNGLDSASIITTSNGGLTWVHGSLPMGMLASGVPEINSLSCVTRTRCFAVGTTVKTLSGEPGAVRNTGFLLVSLDRGTTWTNNASPPGAEQVDEIACESTTDCVATTGGDAIEAAGLFTTSNSGRTWTAQNLSPRVISLYDIACPSTSSCVTVGSGVSNYSRAESAAAVVTHDRGATWTSP